MSSCTIVQNIVGERDEATIQFQVLDHRGVPWVGTEFDSVLFTLHDADDVIVNGQENVEVFGEPAFEFISSYSVSITSINRHHAIMTTAVAHDMRDGYIGLLSGLANGDMPPNGVPAAYATAGPSRITVPRGQWDVWDVVGQSATLSVGILRLALSSDDTQIVAPGPPAWQVQDRYALFRFRLDGQLIKAETIRFGIRNLAVLT